MQSRQEIQALDEKMQDSLKMAEERALFSVFLTYAG